MDQDIVLLSHMQDLASAAYQRGVVLFSDFLNLYELNIVRSQKWSAYGVKAVYSGGYEASERQMTAFVPDALCYEWDFPYTILKISPSAPRFAETLSHRDYLGAILSLGIDRSQIGDILIQTSDALVFVCDKMVDYLIKELVSVRHTPVIVSILSEKDFIYEPNLQEITGNIASLRLDSLIALGFHCSRSTITPLLSEGHIFVNGRVMTSNGYHIRENDLISVRGMGKLKYSCTINETKKGRLFVKLYRYI